MKTNIPLSWSFKDIKDPKFTSVRLPLSGLTWIHTAEIPSSYKINDLCRDLESEFDEGFLLRGCSGDLAGYLSNKGYKSVRTGAEGIINLNLLDRLPKSVTELVKRGDKLGSVNEVAHCEVNQEKVARFIKHTPYGSKPRLQYLFRNTFDSETRCFVYSDLKEQWQGVLTISVKARETCHTEMILRNKTAEVGVMESLFLAVMYILKDEGYMHFSLGEVPFVTPKGMKEDNINSNFIKSLNETFLFKSGHLLRYAFNYKGLFDFKNKFIPEWKPIYICATPKLPLLSLLDLFGKTNYLSLSLSQIVYNVKTLSLQTKI